MKEVLSVLTTKETKLWEDMQNFFKGIMEQARNDPQIKENTLSQKFQTLMTILIEKYKQNSKQKTIIFVERRYIAKLLCENINMIGI